MTIPNPLKSVTIGGVVTVFATYLVAHFDPAVFGSTYGPVVAGVLGVLIGVLTHHTVTSTTPGS